MNNIIRIKMFRTICTNYCLCCLLQDRLETCWNFEKKSLCEGNMTAVTTVTGPVLCKMFTPLQFNFTQYMRPYDSSTCMNPVFFVLAKPIFEDNVLVSVVFCVVLYVSGDIFSFYL